MAGKFIGIGVGPGDPELITVKAVNALKTVDVIFVPKAHANTPSIALGMIKHILAERTEPPEVLELVFPMTKNESEVQRLWAKNASLVAEKAKNGKAAAFITLGDPMFYSTFIYLFRSLRQDYPEVKVEIIPGVTALTACAASAQVPLAEKEEVVAIIPSDLDSALIEETAKHADNLVFMKCAHRFKDLVPILEKSSFTENSTVALVRRCTMPEEKVIVGRICDVKNWAIPEDYFSMAIVRRSELPISRKQGDVP
ncbi:MAG: precorrin-2 C(20)-methyltransferase [Candidatus Bathyarchaeota archaeon]|nr:precorrin-2 C(20)-methyltransferase [Candidatus Bathyarchaeota archaeon]